MITFLFFPPSTHQRKFNWETTSSKGRRAAHSEERPPHGARVSRRPAGSCSAQLAAPSMLHGPSTPAGGPGALGPSTRPLTQDAPGAHLHVPPRSELDWFSCQSTKRASFVSGCTKSNFPKCSAFAGKRRSLVTITIKEKRYPCLICAVGDTCKACSLRQHIY